MAWLVLAAVPLWSQESQPDPSEACLDCHDEIAEYLAITVHQKRFQVNCVDCHGMGLTHIDDPDVGNIPNGKGNEGAKPCLTCHESGIHRARPGLAGPGRDVHASGDVFCADCHAIHPKKPAPRPQLQAESLDLCLSCHTDVRTMLAKPFGHKLGHGAMTCASCHDPHGAGISGFPSFGPVTKGCTDCHSQQKGPHVFEHVSGVAGDCMTCHEPHGSGNPKQLTRPAISQLCLECHSTAPAGNLGSMPPTSHDLRNPRFQNCTICHTAIHGSSRSPLLLK